MGEIGVGKEEGEAGEEEVGVGKEEGEAGEEEKEAGEEEKEAGEEEVGEGEEKWEEEGEEEEEGETAGVLVVRPRWRSMAWVAARTSWGVRVVWRRTAALR